MMQVLLLTFWRVLNSKGGAEKVFFDMAAALSQKGLEVTALALDNAPEGQPLFPLSPQVNFINVGRGFNCKMTPKHKWQRLTYLDKNKRAAFDEEYYVSIKAERIRAVIEKIQPKVIISYCVEATRACIRNLKVACPVITMFHMDPDTILKPASPATRAAVEKSAWVQVLLPGDVARTQSYLPKAKIICIPNAVPQYPAVSRQREQLLINVGRIDRKQKRQHLLIEAFHQIEHFLPDWKIEFWGEQHYDEEYYQYCLALIKSYGLT